MKKTVFLAAAAVALASCSSDELVNNSAVNEAPIAFNVGQKNITRAEPQKLEDTGHYNFGVWAYKTRTSGDPTSQLVMENYLVGYSDGVGKGYDNSKVKESTWASSAGSETDHKSSWFYEGLGSSEYSYTGDASFYKTSESARANQYLRYWDLAYTNTNFYAYAPYKSSGVSFENGIITVAKEANVAGYDDPANHDFIYAGAQALNKNQHDVTLSFKHLGALVKVAFRENVNGYKVQLIDVTSTSGSGIQATTAKKEDDGSYTHSDDVTYLTSCKATINFNNTTTSSITSPSVSPVTDGATNVTVSSENLEFSIPTKDNGLVAYPDDNNPTYYVLPEVSSPSDNKYAVSPKTYYAVVQPSGSKTGFTFHISYNLIAKDNGEVVTVRDARVHVPAEQVCWESNKSYTYNFTISQVSSGTTDPDETKIDLADPTVPKGTVCPIVFDGATISDYDPDTKNI